MHKYKYSKCYRNFVFLKHVRNGLIIIDPFSHLRTAGRKNI